MPPHTPLTRVVQLLGNAASHLFLLIVVISAFEVLMRYVVGQPTVWAHELSVAFAATCFIVGGPAVHASRSHIAISVVYEKMPPRVRSWVRLLCSLLALAFLVCLAYAAALQGWQALQQGETTGTALNWPIPAYLKALFAAAVALMALQTLAHVAEDLERIRRQTR